MNWRWILAKHLINRKFENGFCLTFDTFCDHTEDFARSSLLTGGELFIDAGAHHGLWTLPASSCYKQVIAFEPTPKIAKTLRTNLRTNGIRNVMVIESALTDKVGSQPFYRWNDGPMGNSLYREPVTYTQDYGRASDEYFMVETVSLDSMRLEPTTIKLDVEGAEYDAVKGGFNTIRKYRPKLFIEIHRPENEQRIIDALPLYNWEKHRRLIHAHNKTDFYQTQMIGQVN